MKVLNWNINLRTQKRSRYKESIEASELVIPGFVSKVLNEISSDIIVLTEFVKCYNWKEFVDSLKDYDVFMNCDNEKKGILIAVKKDMEVIEVVKEISRSHNCLVPHFLQMKIRYKNKEVYIIGTRIKVNSGDRTDFEQRRIQFYCLKEHIFSLDEERIIVAGDFNNARIVDNYEGKAQEPYNYDKIKKWFAKINMNLIEIEGYSHAGYLKEDHLIISKSLEAEGEYSSEYISEDYLAREVYYNIYFKGNYYKKRNITLPIGYPDHYILKAKVRV